jgi:hypothetical protein
MAVRIDNISVGTSGATATLTGPCDAIMVVNVDGAGVVSFRIDGTAASDQADENYVVPAIAGAYRKISVPRGWGGSVSLDASATTQVSVEGLTR